MPTKLSRLCLGVMEAAWLAAVSVVPIFFNIYSSRIFEPDKIAILRSLALLTLAAWAVKLVDEGVRKGKKLSQNTPWFRYLLHYPMIAPVFGLILVYTISTIFSVTPANSFFGSYQRLQGTYTTFSYLIIFFSIIVNLRKREQVNRLVTTVILTSLPVSLYGLLQRMNIDPIPWGGNVQIRIASNMGNSIFVAAYLIMVFPLTFGRIVESFKAILTEKDESTDTQLTTIKEIIRGSIYVFIAALELIAIYMSGSRGPLLGLLAGGYILLLLLSIYWRRRWLTFSVIGLAILGAAFLVVFNLNNGPFDALKKSPAIGRFGNLLNSESNSALVRQYIWEGVVKLVGIHDPLKFPDGSTDKFNLLRPLIGYGPESMYVAYNQFYVPELGQVEKRNASPDRAHNETWDSVVITGFSGLLVYLSIFSAVFYYGLKWQGLVKTQRDKWFFFICLVSGGVIGAVALIIFKGIEYLGVGSPFGMIIGVVIYLTLNALIFWGVQIESSETRNPYRLLMIVLFAAIIGHFVEINFGIAIVATRTLFWTYAGLILVIGFVLPKLDKNEAAEPEVENNVEVKGNSPGRRKERGNSRASRKADRSKRPFIGDQPDWVRNALIGSVIVGIMLATLGFDFVTNSNHSTSFLTIIINSLSRLNNHNDELSLGILLLMAITCLIGILLFAAETDNYQDLKSWLKTLGIMAITSLVIGVGFWLLQGISLAALQNYSVTGRIEFLSQVSTIGALLAKYYLYIFVIFIIVAFLFSDDWPTRNVSPSYLGAVLLPFAFVFILVGINTSNLKVIRADITFKMADPFTKNGQWDVSELLYKESLKLAPKEDHYYLFLGRNYLEKAKDTNTTADQDTLVLAAETDLKVAQSINPLNTDHTANLARLYTWWAGKAARNSTTQVERAQQASDYYATAVTLSPNNSTLWDEWAILYMKVIGQSQQALDRLQHALELDPKYAYTQGLLGDYYFNVASSLADPTEKQQTFLQSAGYYQAAAGVAKYTDSTTKATYLMSFSNAYFQIARLNPQNIDNQLIQQAIDVLVNSVKTGVGSGDLWEVQVDIAKLYFLIGDKTNMQYYANQALAGAPSTETGAIQDLITQSQTMP